MNRLDEIFEYLLNSGYLGGGINPDWTEESLLYLIDRHRKLERVVKEAIDCDASRHYMTGEILHKKLHKALKELENGDE